MLELDSRTFDLEDQRVFSKYSGDWNPIHNDHIYARRYMEGNIVVHGIHILLWALNTWSRSITGKLEIERINVQFIAPVNLGERVTCFVTENNSLLRTIEIYCQNIKVILINFSIDQNKIFNHKPIKGTLSEFKNPIVNKLHQLCDKLGSWQLDVEYNQTEFLFPELFRSGNISLIATLIHTSRLVGMECPGLSSLYSEVELTRSADINSELFSYEVLNTDKRFNLTSMNIISGNFSGTVKAFIRKSVDTQYNLTEIRKCVSQNRFSNKNVLVIGGSRGLGELASKILAVGGADVCLSYYQGSTDAERIVYEIKELGGKVSAINFNIEENINFETLFGNSWLPSCLFYFPTPRIFLGKHIGFSSNLLDRFVFYYVTAFSNIVEELYKSGLRKVFYPSTIALNTLPTNMAEYCTAKAGGELMCEMLMKRHKGLEINFPRLPRLATDQTMSFLPINNQDPLAIILAEIDKIMN